MVPFIVMFIIKLIPLLASCSICIRARRWIGDIDALKSFCSRRCRGAGLRDPGDLFVSLLEIHAALIVDRQMILARR